MSRLNDLSIGKRLIVLSGTMTILFMFMAVVGHWSGGKSEKHLDRIFNDRILPIEQLVTVRDMLTENRTLLMLADSYKTPESARAAGDAIAHNAQIVTGAWKAYMETALTPEEKFLAERFATERAAWVASLLKPAIESLARGESLRARELVTEHSGLLDKTLATGKELVQLQVRMAKEEYANASRASALSNRLLWGSCAIGTAFGLMLAFLITRSITQPIDGLRLALDRLASDRDLTMRLSVRGRDECAQMATAFNAAMASMDTTLQTIKQQSQELSASAIELAGASRTIKDGTQAQSEAASATAASIEELAVSVSHVADNADNATDLATRSNTAAAEGTGVVKSASDEMSRIADDVRSSSAKAQSLAQRSNDISGIVQVIKDVADQTNLLALNAAIEAARAGDQGRGFAVVADEVRKLAERTSRSAAEITELISVVQTDTRMVVATMESSISRVDAGVQLAQQAAQSLEDIRIGAAGTCDKISEIANATREQSTASNDIARHVERIAQMTEENSAAANQSAALSERLESLAESLRGAVSRFKTA